MDIALQQPLAQFLGLRESINPDCLLEIDFSPNLANHFNSYHASALFGFAEYSAGAYLIKNFPEQRHSTLPLVRSARVKYSRRPNSKTLFSKGTLLKKKVTDALIELEEKGKTILQIQINVVDEHKQLVFKGNYEWLVSMKT